MTDTTPMATVNNIEQVENSPPYISKYPTSSIDNNEIEVEALDLTNSEGFSKLDTITNENDNNIPIGSGANNEDGTTKTESILKYESKSKYITINDDMGMTENKTCTIGNNVNGTGSIIIPRLNESHGNNSKKTSSSLIQADSFIDILGNELYSLNMTSYPVQMNSMLTNEVLSEKKVVGLYFSADWCKPCREFTPQLVKFYQKVNSYLKHNNTFVIIWISQSKNIESYIYYYASMDSFYALPFKQASGVIGKKLLKKYKIQGIPSLVLLDKDGLVIRKNAYEKVKQDRLGIGFPWRNPCMSLIRILIPIRLRMLLQKILFGLKKEFLKLIQRFIFWR